MVVDQEHPRPAVAGVRAPDAGAPAPSWLASAAGPRLTWASSATTSVPSPGALRTVAEPPRLAIRACTDSARPFLSPGTAAGSKPRPRSRTNSDTESGSTSANSDTTSAPDHFAALTVASLAAASIAVRSSSSSQSPDRHGIDRHAVLSLDVLLDQPDRVGDRRGLAVDRPWRAAVEQPGAQLALLGPGQLHDLLRIACPPLDQGQRLEHRVVHARGHIGPFLGPDPGLALVDQVPRDAQPPRAERGGDAADQQQDADKRPQQLDALRVPAEQRRQAESEQSGRQQDPQYLAGSSAGAGLGDRVREPAQDLQFLFGALRQISTRPAALTISGTASEVTHGAFNADAMIRPSTTTEVKAAARPKPRLSASALVPMLDSAPAAGISSHATT